MNDGVPGDPILIARDYNKPFIVIATALPGEHQEVAMISSIVSAVEFGYSPVGLKPFSFGGQEAGMVEFLGPHRESERMLEFVSPKFALTCSFLQDDKFDRANCFLIAKSFRFIE